MSGEPGRIAVIGGSTLFRASLALLLEAQGWDVQESPWPSTREAASSLAELCPPMAIVDLIGAQRQQRAIVSELSKRDCRVLVIAPNSSRPMVGRCIEMGATALISMEEPFEALIAELHALLSGQRPWSDAERAALVADWHAARDEENGLLERFERLTPRETAVLVRVIDGQPAAQIATAELMSLATVRAHIQSILRKLDVSSQLEAVAMARRADWPERPAAS